MDVDCDTIKRGWITQTVLVFSGIGTNIGTYKYFSTPPLFPCQKVPHTLGKIIHWPLILFYSLHDKGSRLQHLLWKRILIHRLLRLLDLFCFCCNNICDNKCLYCTTIILLIPSSSIYINQTIIPWLLRSNNTLTNKMPSTLNNFGMFALNLMEKIDPGNLGKDKNEEYTNIHR